MTGCIALRKDVYYVRLTYYDRNHQRKEKWVSTGLSGRGAKQKATAMIDSMIEKYKYLFVDEYQDINSIQEQILNKLVLNNNIVIYHINASTSKI